MATVCVTGASGFVGSALSERLASRHSVIRLSRTEPKSVHGQTWRKCDLFSLLDAEKALEGVEVAIYLVHSMLPSARLSQGSFEDFDLIAADNFARACRKQGVKQIIYLGGIVPPADQLSRHLESRREVERVLASHGTPVTVVRAGLIVGAEGSSFQMIARLVKRLPVMICPAWTESLTQPIALEDIVGALDYCVDNESVYAKQFDVGAPELLTYRLMLEQTAEAMGLTRHFWRFPFFTPGLSRLWVTLITGAPKALVQPLVQSLRHDMTVRDQDLLQQAGIRPLSFKEAVRRNLDSVGKSTPRAYRSAKPSAVVRSVQRFTLPLGRSADWAAREYMAFLPRFIPWILRVEIKSNECTIRLRLFKKPLLVLEYAPDRSTPDRALFYIRGGSLVGELGRGRLEFRQLADPQVLIAALHEYSPSLPWYVYKATQAFLHIWVMQAFGRWLERLNPDPQYGDRPTRNSEGKLRFERGSV